MDEVQEGRTVTVGTPDVTDNSKILIELVDNGMVVTMRDGSRQVFATHLDSHDEDDLVGLQGMLYAIMEDLGHYGSKHDRARVTIAIVHGDDYGCKEKGCKICEDEIL